MADLARVTLKVRKSMLTELSAKDLFALTCMGCGSGSVIFCGTTIKMGKLVPLIVIASDELVVISTETNPLLTLLLSS